jgi:RHS repeat-associated protein
MPHPNRLESANEYRYGFNGMEKDDEVSGEGNSYNTTFRQYDSRVVRWLSVDPLSKKAAGWTPYRINFDNPIVNIDPNGAYEIDVKLSKQDKKGIRKKYKGRERKIQKRLLIEERADQIRETVNLSKKIIDNNPKARDAFVKYTGINPETNPEGWSQLWEEGTGGPLLVNVGGNDKDKSGGTSGSVINSNK